jgi:Beta-L-arabinofuranosidase, GH127
MRQHRETFLRAVEAPGKGAGMGRPCRPSREKGFQLRQETKYPESQNTTLTVTAARPGAMAMRLRVPGWLKADRTKVTIQDVVAAEGPRLPDVDHSQKQFNTGMVVIVEHGNKPSQELIDRTNAIKDRWVDYWATTTGHRSSMTTKTR